MIPLLLALARRSPVSILKAVQNAGLTSNLMICLDPGDSASWPNTGSTWADRSGVGNDFTKASGATFTGTAGVLPSYFTMSGSGSWFTLGTSNPTSINSLHKDSAAFSILCAIYHDTEDSAIFGTNGGSNSNIGIKYAIQATTYLQTFQVSKGSSVLSVSGSTALNGSGSSEKKYHIIGLSVDEANNTGFFYADGAYDQVSSSNTFTSTYSSPSASAATYTAQIGAAGNNAVPFGGRLGWFLMWNGSALTKANFDAIRANASGRYGC